MVKLTVIVTVYNIAAYLPRFFESMARQTYKDYILLVIDDGSEDDSLAVCRRYADLDPRIRVVPSEHRGITGIKNYAMELIETEFNAYVDGDDYVEPDYLKHLMDAREKYDADLVISRVQYLLENGAVEGEFCSRGEMYISSEEFREKLPMLLDDRRLNYLYAKVYRSSILKELRVESDVRQGMDTMFNIQYLGKINSIVLIDDVDYHYIRYTSRSITSYSGKDTYERICRINRYIYDQTEQMGLLSEELLAVIDQRVLESALWSIGKTCKADVTDDVRAQRITDILNSDDYTAAYERQMRRGTSLGFDVVRPQDGAAYLRKKKKAENVIERKKRILRLMPSAIVSVWHKLKGITDSGD